LHAEGYKGVNNIKRGGLEYDFTGVIEDIGVDKLVKNVGAKKIIEAVGPEKFVEDIGVDKLVANVGVKRIIDAVGGPKKVLEVMGVDWLLDGMTAAQRKEFKKRLNA
jgi:hypothetical protein